MPDTRGKYSKKLPYGGSWIAYGAIDREDVLWISFEQQYILGLTRLTPPLMQGEVGRGMSE